MKFASPLIKLSLKTRIYAKILSLYLLKPNNITKLNILSGRYTHQDLDGLSIFKKNLPLKIKNIDTKGLLLVA